MDIHWFSPLPPEETDIGNFSVHVCQQLRQRCALTVWTHPRHCRRFSGNRHGQRFRLLPYDAVDEHLEDLNRSDCIFYNIGNNAAFHREIIAVMKRFPGVAILHDLSLFECFSSVYRERYGGDSLFLELVNHVYGSEGKELADLWLLSSDNERKELPIAEKCPFVSTATLGAWGLISHTEISPSSELNEDPRPRWCLPLPYPSSEDWTPSDNQPSDSLDLVVFGYIGGSNRRLKEILHALSAFSQRSQLHLHIAGKLNPSLEIEGTIAELGLKEQVTVHGFLKDEQLDALLRNSDLVLNLRYPTRGEASGSLLRAWNMGASVAVSKTGFYGDLPDELVFKIDPFNETNDLCTLWSRILDKPTLLTEMSRVGREYLIRHHGLSPYVEALLEIARTTDAVRGPSLLPMLEERFGLVAANTLEVSDYFEEHLLGRLESELTEWFRDSGERS